MLSFRTRLENQTEELVEELVFQLRISFVLPPPSEGRVNGLTPDTIVVGYESTLAAIFGIAGISAKWRDIKQSVLSYSNVEPLWVPDIEAAAQSMDQDRSPPQNEALCVSMEGNFYWPVAAGYEKYRSGARNCYVVFIPARNRQFNLNFRTSLVISGLILSVRFRQRVLPILTDLKALPRKMETLLKLQKEITGIETEAIEVGLGVPKSEHDDPPLLHAFRDGIEKDKMRKDMRKWINIRNHFSEMISSVKAPNGEVSPSEVVSFVMDSTADMAITNSDFIRALAQELLYLERIEAEQMIRSG